MPLLIWPALAAFFGGAFVGSQVDDKIDPIPNAMGMFELPSGAKVIAYGLAAAGVYLLYKKVQKA